MKEKLNTKKIKKLITQWLSDEKIVKDIILRMYHTYEEDDGELLDAEYWGCQKNCSKQELEDRIAFLWSDGNNWRRNEKCKLKYDWETFLSGVEYKLGHIKKIPHFNIDIYGWSNDELVIKLFNDPKTAAKCIKRSFEPCEQFADNFRLEVITTPEDDEVVGWTVYRD
jgi:hypothetical protein